MYCNVNFKTKKALKEAIAAGEKIGIHNPGLGGPPPQEGTAFLEGPWYPEPHKWYAEVTLKEGVIVKVK